MKLVLAIVLSMPLLSCSTTNAYQADSKRKVASSSCHAFLEGVVVGYEVDDYGRSSKREDTNRLMDDWTSSELEFLIMPTLKYKNLSADGKNKLEISFEMFSYDGSVTLTESFDEWEKWPRKGKSSYMRVKGFNLSTTFAKLVHPVYERYSLGSGAKKQSVPKKKNLPHRMVIKLFNNQKKSMVCSHTITLNLEDRH